LQQARGEYEDGRRGNKDLLKPCSGRFLAEVMESHRLDRIKHGMSKISQGFVRMVFIGGYTRI
jgi:hypothetical protein